MSKLVVQGAQMRCSMGISPSAFGVSGTREVAGEAVDAGHVGDHSPNTNIPPFGMCQSMSNPQVQAATAAALGVLTPQPCAPLVPSPWTPGSTSVVVSDQPALHDACTCACQWGGTISVSSAGQSDIEVD